MAVTIFWLMIVLLLYIWGGYLFVLRLLTLFLSKPVDKNEFYPSVTIILTVFNEEKVIRKRLDNLIALDYPKDMLEILVASDGSTDRTNEIVGEYGDRNVVLSIHEGKGKSVTQNAAVNLAKGDIIVFTDAEALFETDFLKNMVANFNDEKVGCVTGDISLIHEGGAISKGQSMYWDLYENSVRRYESEIGSLAKAAGNSLAIRKRLFVPLEGKYGEDCIVPLDTVLQGYRVVHEPGAVVHDEVPSSLKGEFNTRVRMTLRNWNGILSKKQILNPLRFPMAAFSLLSHKVLRWLSMFFLIIVFVSNLFLLNMPFYQITLFLQSAFYLCAFIGFLLEKKAVKSSHLFSIPFGFCLANIGMGVGVLRAFTGKEIVKYKMAVK